MGQVASASSSSKDDTYDEKDTDQSIESSEGSYEEEVEDSLNEDTDIASNMHMTNNPTESGTTYLTTPLGIEEVILQIQNFSAESLKKRIEIASLTRESILECTRSHRGDLPAMNDKYANLELSQDSEERVEEKIALLILGLSPNLRFLRYKLVPSRMKEGMFWAAIFRMIVTTAINSNHDIMEPNKEISSTLETKLDNTSSPGKSIAAELSSHSSRSIVNTKLVEAENRIKELEIALEAAYRILRETKTVSLERPVEKKVHHRGRWIIDKDCRDFLSLDEEIKKQLREGKKKRIHDILNELRFILDSDDEREARGKWDCCGNNQYTGVGCSS